MILFSILVDWAISITVLVTLVLLGDPRPFDQGIWGFIMTFFIFSFATGLGQMFWGFFGAEVFIKKAIFYFFAAMFFAHLTNVSSEKSSPFKDMHLGQIEEKIGECPQTKWYITVFHDNGISVYNPQTTFFRGTHAEAYEYLEKFKKEVYDLINKDQNPRCKKEYFVRSSFININSVPYSFIQEKGWRTDQIPKAIYLEDKPY